MKKLTVAENQIMNALKNGATLWRYSKHRRGHLVDRGSIINFNLRTIENLIKLDLIEEDINQSYYREGSGNDIYYKLK